MVFFAFRQPETNFSIAQTILSHFYPKNLPNWPIFAHCALLQSVNFIFLILNKMSLHDNGYIFKPHEQPLMAGSPSSPEHTKARKIAYLLIGILLIVCSGLQNGLLTASIAEVRGELALDGTLWAANKV